VMPPSSESDSSSTGTRRKVFKDDPEVTGPGKGDGAIGCWGVVASSSVEGMISMIGRGGPGTA
jgi:hypothetical protein